jgi:hypothetical protein
LKTRPLKEKSTFLSTYPKAVFDGITFLAQALPKRSVPTFLELLFGAMLTQTGLVADALLAIDPLRHWTSSYKWQIVGDRRKPGSKRTNRHRGRIRPRSRGPFLYVEPLAK